VTIDAVIFDWGGTLTPWHVIDQLESWRTVTDDPALARALADAELAVWTRAKEHHVSGHIDEILAAAGAAFTDEQLRSYYAWWDAHSWTDPHVVPLFESLRARGLKVGVLSNTIWPRSEHERIFERDGVHHLIDGAVYSSEISHTKPHAEAFRAALDAVGVDDPSRAVYVGDRLFEDVWGPQQIGMRAVFVPHSVIPDWQLTGVEGIPDATVHSLDELIPVIDRWLKGTDGSDGTSPYA
jgi:putative hydrolase of the HAD superfamily